MISFLIQYVKERLILTFYTTSQEEEKGPPIRIIKGIIGKLDSKEEVLAEL